VYLYQILRNFRPKGEKKKKNNLSSQNKIQPFASHSSMVAIKRLTALWAFLESGVGGVLHIVQMPFVGLFIGGFAVIIITNIAKYSNNSSSQIFKSLLIVVLVKLSISPFTPFTAYVAVAFQAIFALLIFKIFKINYFSILVVCVVAMLESAFQKLLIVWLLFGKPFFMAIDVFVKFVGKQIGGLPFSGSQIFVVLYVLLYVLGGVFVAQIAYLCVNKNIVIEDAPVIARNSKDSLLRMKNRLPFLKFGIVLAIVSILLFLANNNCNVGFLLVLKTIVYTILAIFIWYFVVLPVCYTLLKYFFKNKLKRYSNSIESVVLVFPDLKVLTKMAWQKTHNKKGLARCSYFAITLIHWSITYNANKDLE
jgi:hypothetical protein